MKLNNVEILVRNWWSCFTEPSSPLGSCGVHHKKAPLETRSLFVPLPQLLASGPLKQPLTAYVFWYLPPTGTQERQMHVLSLKEQDKHTVKFQQEFYLQTFKHPLYLHIPTLKPLQQT